MRNLGRLGGTLTTPIDEPVQRSDKYTAVIFVHGMGRQSQYENLGRLLKALEEHCYEPMFGWLRQFQARTEPSRTGDVDDVPFVQFDRFEPRRHSQSAQGRWRFKGRFRAYEAYWSPVTARGAHPLRVALWALRQLAKLEATRGASWRQYTHLRIARLHSLMANAERIPDRKAARRRDYLFASLLAHIQRFRGHEGARHREAAVEGAAGESEFVDFASGKIGAAVSDSELRDLVASWGGTRLPVEDLATVMARRLSLMVLALAVFGLSLGLDIWRQGLGVANGTMTAILIAVLIAAGVAGAWFLARTFSDVYIWNSNQAHDHEHARRQEVLSRTRSLVEHVASDPACKRLVIVAHSLGTPITLETLALIGRRNEARAKRGDIVPLSKLSHFVTLGSPIDKIFYFFQTREAQTYRAGRLHDDLRGTLSQEPFFRDGAPRVDWLNFWDPADIVSDPLHSPRGNKTDGADILSADIFNFEVENGASFSAWKNHVGYLDNDDVVESIAAAIFKNATERPLSGPSRRDPKLRAARAIALRWTPLALVVGGLAAAIGYGVLGAGLALAPAVCFALRAAISGTPQQRFNRRQWRARLKARLLVAVPPGD